MKQFLIEIDDQLAEQIDRVAPPRSRRRSQFIRRAIQQRLWEMAEEKTADAYTRQPDSDAVYWDADLWEQPASTKASPPKRPNRSAR